MAKMKIKVKDLGGSGGMSDPAEDYGYSGTAPAKEKPVVKSGVKLVKVEIPAKERSVRVENTFVKQKRRWPWVILSLVIGFIAGVSYQQYRARQDLNTLANNFTENYEQARNEINNQLEEQQRQLTESYNNYFSGNNGNNGSLSSIEVGETSSNDFKKINELFDKSDTLADEYIALLQQAKQNPSSIDSSRMTIIKNELEKLVDEIDELKGSNYSQSEIIELEARRDSVVSKLDKIIELQNEVNSLYANNNSSSSSSESSMRPDFKQFLDEYESFVDEYVEFMAKYQSGQLSMNDVMRYTTITAEYAEMSQKVQKLKNDNLTTEEMNYYIEVTSRVAKKLNKIASSMVK